MLDGTKPTGRSAKALVALGVVAGIVLGVGLTLLLEPNRRLVGEKERSPWSDLRLVEGRLVGLSGCGSCRQLTPAEARAAIRRGSSQAALRALARSREPRDRVIAALVGGRVDGAIAALEGAASRAPGDAAALSDLSAVYSDRAGRENRPADSVAALEMAERALSVHPALAEARFNRALALEHLFLDFEAARAWREYLELDGRPAWSDEALAHLQRPRLDIGLSSRDLAREDGVAVVDRQLDAATWNEAAASLDALGEHEKAWSYRYRALSLARSLPPSPVVFAVDAEAVRGCLLGHWPRAALDFQSHLIAAMEIAGLVTEVPAARLNKARIEAVLGRQVEAQRDFARALGELERVPPEKRAELATVVDITRAAVRESETQAAALAGEAGMDYLVAPPPPGLELLNLRAEFDARRGDALASVRDLERAVDEIESRRETIARDSLRISFLDEARPLYERLVALDLNLSRPDRALDALERFRARVLLDRRLDMTAHGAGASPGMAAGAVLTAEEICRRLPAHTAIVVYAVIDGRLVTWIVHSSGVGTVTRPPAWSEVTSLVRSLREAIWVGEGQVLPILKQLDGVLVAPWHDQVAAGDRLIFVPTLDLQEVPFAALLDARSRRFLVQDHPSGVAASASEFVAAMERDRRMAERPIRSVLLVGNPGSERSPDRLPGAAREIESVSHIYAGVEMTVLTRQRATPEAVLGELAKADIVHLAVHAMEDRRDAGQSALVLSPASGQSGLLRADAILRQKLPHTRLVMLAACDTRAGPVSPSEGAQSLASAFLAAGVPAVVGSLWKVEDSSTARLSVRFHEEVSRGADALAALRTAQMEEIARQKGSGFEWTWAGFQVFGGVVQLIPSAAGTQSSRRHADRRCLCTSLPADTGTEAASSSRAFGPGPRTSTQ